MSAIQGDTFESNGKAFDRSAERDEPIRLCERKGRFIPVAGHELRNELSLIVTSLGCLVQYSENDTQAERSRIVAQHARQLGRLIHDLFDASRLASPATIERRQALYLTRCDPPFGCK